MQNILANKVSARETEIGLAAMHIDGHLPGLDEIQLFENKLAKRIATVGWFMGIGDDDKNRSEFPLDILIKDYKLFTAGEKSVIPMVTLEPWGQWKKDANGKDEGPLHRINQDIL